MPRLLSVNVGLARDVTWNGKTTRCAVQQPHRVQIQRRSGKPTKSWPELVRLVHDRGAGRAGSANLSSPRDSWEELNHAF
jgi:hypothetical protein